MRPQVLQFLSAAAVVACMESSLAAAGHGRWPQCAASAMLASPWRPNAAAARPGLASVPSSEALAPISGRDHSPHAQNPSDDVTYHMIYHIPPRGYHMIGVCRTLSIYGVFIWFWPTLLVRWAERMDKKDVKATPAWSCTTDNFPCLSPHTCAYLV